MESEEYARLVNYNLEEMKEKDMKIAELEESNKAMHANGQRWQIIRSKMEIEMDSLREALEVKTLQLENCMK